MRIAMRYGVSEGTKLIGKLIKKDKIEQLKEENMTLKNEIRILEDSIKLHPDNEYILELKKCFIEKMNLTKNQ